MRVSARQPPPRLPSEHMRFVEEYLLDLDARSSALRAGLPAEVGPTLLARSDVQLAIQVAKSERARRTAIYSDEVLRSWELARRVDYNEFVSVIVPPCRHCWGINHHFQFTSLYEMEQLGREHALSQSRIKHYLRHDFDTEGGEGYSVLRQPCRGPEWASFGEGEVNSDHSCPECNGMGAPPRVLVRDTRRLSHGARYIYEGAERTKDGGVKLNLRSRKEFDEMVGRHLGLVGTSAHPVPPADPNRMSDEQLDSVLQTYGITVEVDYEEVSAGPEPTAAPE